MNPRLAAWLPSYGADLRVALEQARAQRYRAVHASTAIIAAREFPRSARRHLQKFLGDLGVELGALAVDFPGLGVADPQRGQERLDQVRATLELAAELGVPRAAVALGGLHDPRSQGLAREALQQVAELADRVGVQTSIRNPLDPPAVLLEALGAVGCPYLSVALDTAAAGALAAVGPAAAERVGTVYLRDVRQAGERVEEVPFGQGEVDFTRLLANLATARGELPLVVRHDGAGGVDALRHGREYMDSLLSRRNG
jgi:sugar phosphate isomerase/epimerase